MDTTAPAPLLPLVAFLMAALAAARMFDEDGDALVPYFGLLTTVDFDAAMGAAVEAMDTPGADRELVSAAMARKLYAGYGTSDYQANLRHEASWLLAWVETFA